MKKLAIFILSLITVIICSFALAACGDKNDDPVTDQPADHVHTYVDYKVTKDATCTENGEETAKCTQCDSTNVRAIAALGHKWGTPAKTAATCVAEGYTLTKCSVCNVEEKTDVVSALGHKWDIPEATCTKGQVCLTCSETGAKAHGHIYDEGKIKVAVSCENDGVKVYACTACDDESATFEEVYAKASGHSLDIESKYVEHDECDYIYSAPCYTCEQWIVIGTETIHTYKSKITKAATCSAEGVKTYTCSVCHNDSYTEGYTDANAHKWIAGQPNGNIVTYTCGHNNGHTKTALAVSGSSAEVKASDLSSAGELNLDSATITFDSAAKGVLNGKTDVSVNAGTLEDNNEALADLAPEYADRVNGDIYNFTMEADGEAVSEFGGKLTIKIPYTLGDDEDPEEIAIWYIEGDKLTLIKANYMEIDGDGYAVFETEHFSYYTVTRMTPEERCSLYGHHYVERRKEATCITNGFVIVICTRCSDKEKDEVIPAFGHDWNEVKTAATCTVNGSVVKTCKTCEISVKNTVFAEGHKWVIDESKSKTATCTASGKSHYDCSNCDESYEMTEAQKSHRWQSTVVAPTCTTKGYTSKECANCGTSTVTDEKAALGHDLVATVVAPTCTEGGFTMHECSRCGYRANDTDKVAALGHNKVNGVCERCGEGCSHKWQDSKHVEATCTEGGYTLIVCSKCKAEKKENVKPALGHDFGVTECSRCHTLNPALAQYYKNLLESLNISGVAVKATGIEIKIEQDSYKNGELEGSEVVEYIKQIGIMEIMLSIDSGYIYGVGQGSLTVELPEEGEVMDVSAKILVDGRTVYIIANMDGGDSEYDTQYVKLDIDVMFGNAGTYDAILEYYNWVQDDPLTVLSNFVDANSDIVNTVIRKVLGIVFEEPKEVTNGYEYVLNCNAFYDIVNDLENLTISKLLDKYVGEGAYMTLTDGIKTLLNKNVVELFNSIEDYGIDYDAVCAAVDKFMYLMTGAPFDTDAMLKEYFLKGGPLDASVAEVVAAMTGMVDEDGKELVTSMVESSIGMLEDVTVFSLLPEEAVGYVHMYINQIVGYINRGFDVSFTTDKKGNITSIDIDAKGEKLHVGGRSYGGDWDGYGEYDYYSYEIFATISGKISIIPNGRITVDFEDEIVKKVESEVRLGKNISAVSSSYNWNSTIELRTDGYGNITSLMRYRASYSYESGSGYEIYNGVRTYYVDNTQVVEVYDFNMKYGYQIVASDASICKTWKEISVSAIATVNQIARYTRVYFDVAGNVLASVKLQADEKLDGRTYTTTYGVEFYYDTATQAISYDTPHHYVLDEANSVAPKGCTDKGYRLYVCSLCNESRKDYYTNGHKEVTTGTLLDGATTCDEGVVIVTSCSECGETLSTRTYHGHYTYFVIIDATEYGSKCGGYIEIHRCACGRETYVEWVRTLECEMHYSSTEGEEVYKCAVTDCPFEFKITRTQYYDREHCMDYIYYDYAIGSNTENPYLIHSIYDRWTHHDWNKSGDGWSEPVRGKEGNYYTVTEKFNSLQVCKVCNRREGEESTNISYYSDDYYGRLVKSHYESIRYENERRYEEVIDCTYGYNEFDWQYTSHEERRTKDYNSDVLYREGTVVIDYDRYERRDEIISRYGIIGSTLGNYEIQYNYYEEGRLSHTEHQTIRVDYGEYPCYYDVYINTVNTEYHRDGESNFYENNHEAIGNEQHVKESHEYISDATCTQDFVFYVTCEVCGYSDEEPHYSYSRGHDYYYDFEKGVYVCRDCGLENVKGVDGAIILEDLTVREGYEREGYYVIGYNYCRWSDEYHKWWELFHNYYHPYGFGVYVSLIGEDGEYYYNIGAEVEIVDNAHTLIYVSVADVEAAAAKLGLENYIVEIEFVLNDASGLAYNIGLDPNDYIENDEEDEENWEDWDKEEPLDKEWAK